jgi:RND family efflux transporter MFP subunit
MEENAQTTNGGTRMHSTQKWVLALALLIVLAVAIGLGLTSGRNKITGPRDRGDRVAPVEVAAIRQGPIELRRTFSGTLEAAAKFVVAPKVNGRVARLEADLGDAITRGQVVAELDGLEYAQAVLEAQAELAVAVATHLEAKSAFEITTREFRRIEKLQKTGAVSASQYDTTRAEQLAKQAGLTVAAARVNKAEAALATARIRLDYTKITAEWNTGGKTRVVAERFVDEGDTVSENTPLLSIVELDPITGVILVTEKEYARMGIGQEVTLVTDAYPGRTFLGAISRIAPVFRQSTRQARVEISIPNENGLLKPGMFIRATVVMERQEQAILVAEQALTKRGDRMGVFTLDEKGDSVAWKEVTVGIREGDVVQISGEGLAGRVVTLGQQFIEHGSVVVVSDRNATSGKRQVLR